MACNQFGAVYEASGGAISLSSVAVTAAICFRKTVEQEFVTALRGAQIYVMEGDLLQLQGTGGTLNFRPDTGEPQPSPNTPQSSTLATETTPYRCAYESGRPFQFTIREGDSEARVALPALLGGRILSLARVPSASGVKYQTEGVTVWLKGEEALLEVDGETYTGCQPE